MDTSISQAFFQSGEEESQSIKRTLKTEKKCFNQLLAVPQSCSSSLVCAVAVNVLLLFRTHEIVSFGCPPLPPPIAQTAFSVSKSSTFT